MGDIEAPRITKYWCEDAPEGYNFILVENNDRDQIYNETITLFDTINLKMVHDPLSRKYILSVNPGESRMIVMEAKLPSFDYNFAIT